MRILISGGTVVDRTGERRADVRVADGRVTELAEVLAPDDGERVIDASGRVVFPGFVVLAHVTRREGVHLTTCLLLFGLQIAMFTSWARFYWAG